MSDARGRTVVVGGGIIGAMCAWYLAQSGHSVTLIDRATFGKACSHGNCGFVSPSHILPLTRPGEVRRAMKLVLRRNSPLIIRPRLSPSLWSWLLKFARRCNEADMIEAALARHALLQSSRTLYEELITSRNLDCEWEAKGLLFVFESSEEFHAYAATDQLLRTDFGVGATPCDGDALVELEPALKPGLGGAWHYQCDAHLRPDRLMTALRGLLEQHQVEILDACELRSFGSAAGECREVVTSAGNLAVDACIVATGALTPALNRYLGCRIPIQPGKGYSITMPRPERCPSIPMILEPHRVAVTPMQSGYRLGSLMEFAGYDESVRPERLALLRNGARHYLHTPDCEPIEEEWYGWRPMTWDGIPYIDRSPTMKNVWIAAGHNMLGLSMGPATGRLVAELVNGDTPHLDPRAYRINRIVSSRLSKV